jgi:hypothetical protein
MLVEVELRVWRAATSMKARARYMGRPHSRRLTMTRRRVLSIQSDHSGVPGECTTQTVLKVMATITLYNLAGYISTLGRIDEEMYLYLPVNLEMYRTCQSCEVD